MVSLKKILISIIIIIILILALTLGIKKKDEHRPESSPVVNLVAVGMDTTPSKTLLYSYDGKTWKQSSGGVCFDLMGTGVAYGKNKEGDDPMWVAAGRNTLNKNNNLLYSYDGIEWTGVTLGAVYFSDYGEAVAYGLSSDGNNMWVAVGYDSTDEAKSLLYSDDGKTWKKSKNGVSFNDGGGFGVAYGTNGNGTSMWVAVGSDYTDSKTLLYSYDGISWQPSEKWG